MTEKTWACDVVMRVPDDQKWAFTIRRKRITDPSKLAVLRLLLATRKAIRPESRLTLDDVCWEFEFVDE